METEMTKELKEKFIVQYWMQEVGMFPNDKRIRKVGEAFVSFLNIKNGYILLKPLSSITDEDAIEVAKIISPKTDYIERLLQLGRSTSLLFRDEISEFKTKENLLKVLMVADYLRSKSYALPFMGISVEQQVKSGWVKLIENTELTELPDKPLTECMMGRDGECNHPQCPVTDEDEKNGRYCTLPLYDYRE